MGVALSINYLFSDKPRETPNALDGMQGAFLGPQYDNTQIEVILKKHEAVYRVLDEKEVLSLAVSALSQGKVLAWFQGRMEFGPRALGSRTIIGDARSSTMQKTMNLKIKYRESFRPFAPSVRAENISDYFEIDRESPYMLLVANVQKSKQVEISAEQNSYFGLEKLNLVRSVVPAITHVDFSARIQSVNYRTNPRYHQMITKFNDKYGCPVIVNTSFNVRGEPIVLTPEDAFRCFMGTGLDVLVVGNVFLVKEKQTQKKEMYVSEFETD